MFSTSTYYNIGMSNRAWAFFEIPLEITIFLGAVARVKTYYAFLVVAIVAAYLEPGWVSGICLALLVMPLVAWAFCRTKLIDRFCRYLDNPYL